MRFELQVGMALLASLAVALLFGCIGAQAAKPTIALVNHVHFHLEVVAGYLEVLDATMGDVTVFLHPRVVVGNHMGFMDYLGYNKLTFKDYRDLKSHYDVIIFISPEWNLPTVQAIVQVSKPKVVIAAIHNGNAKTLKSIASLTSNTHLVTLAPHVANNVSSVSQNIVHWVLPTKAFTASNPCNTLARLSQRDCLKGFVIQGKVESTRRNYSAIWSQLSARTPILAQFVTDNSHRFHLFVIGEMATKGWKIPTQLAALVSVHSGLPFTQFYNVMHRALGLVPIVASEAYFSHKFSSTLLTSLVTGTPVICSKRMLDVYMMFDKDSVLLQLEDEAEVDTMIRSMSLSTEQLLEKRNALEKLRLRLNAQAREKLQYLISSSIRPTF